MLKVLLTEHMSRLYTARMKSWRREQGPCETEGLDVAVEGKNESANCGSRCTGPAQSRGTRATSRQRSRGGRATSRQQAAQHPIRLPIQRLNSAAMP